MTDLAALTRATAELDPPLAALDLAAARANLADLTRRASGTPVRVASKSVRCRWVLDLALGTPGFAGVMAYSLREALWLVRGGVADVLMGYPTADRGALRELGADPAALRGDHADGRRRRASWPCCRDGAPVRVCLDVDASLRIGRLHLGVRRSPLRTPADAAALAPVAPTSAGCRVVGVMFYEAQIAGLPDRRRPCGWSSGARRPSWRRGGAPWCARCRTRSVRWSSSTRAGRAASRSAPPIRWSPR